MAIDFTEEELDAIRELIQDHDPQQLKPKAHDAIFDAIREKIDRAQESRARSE